MAKNSFVAEVTFKVIGKIKDDTWGIPIQVL